MNDPYIVSTTERGVVRVFTTELDPEGNAAITPKNLQKLLGHDVVLDPAKVEVFPTKMIDALGLSTYLHEGYGIPREDLEGKAVALDSLSGLVILVTSAAFQGKSVTLDPNDALRFIGAFQEPGMAPPVPMAAPETAQGALAPSGASESPPSSADYGWIIAIGALLAAAALVLFAIF